MDNLLQSLILFYDIFTEYRDTLEEALLTVLNTIGHNFIQKLIAKKKLT